MKTMILAAAALGVTFALPASAADMTNRDRLDRIEDRIDRRESYLDRQTVTGPADRIEDVIDRRESQRDRAGFDGPSRIDRHERRSWWQLWGNHQH